MHLIILFLFVYSYFKYCKFVMVSIATVVCYIPKAILPDYDNLEENAAVSLKQW